MTFTIGPTIPILTTITALVYAEMPQTSISEPMAIFAGISIGLVLWWLLAYARDGDIPLNYDMYEKPWQDDEH